MIDRQTHRLIRHRSIYVPYLVPYYWKEGRKISVTMLLKLLPTDDDKQASEQARKRKSQASKEAKNLGAVHPPSGSFYHSFLKLSFHHFVEAPKQ